MEFRKLASRSERFDTGFKKLPEISIYGL